MVALPVMIESAIGWHEWKTYSSAYKLFKVAIRRVFFKLLENLGFGALGPRKSSLLLECAGFTLIFHSDSFAAWWQSFYGGKVPKGSLFAILQKIGMAGIGGGAGMMLRILGLALPLVL